MVLSVEGTVARVRRASLPAELWAGTAEIRVIAAVPAEPEAVVRVAPYRPRARVLPPPYGATPRDRVLQLLGVAEEREPPRRVDAEPPAAATEIIEQLRRWGYLGTGDSDHGKT
jgi:electron transfer flavoprotein beta subunit